MSVLLTNIKNELIHEALEKTGSDSVISILKEGEKILIDTGVPVRGEEIKLEDRDSVSSKINMILKDTFNKGDVELALEAAALGLMILNTAKNFDVFKKKYSRG
ncbi:MAG: hypothetical protein BME94_06345 [Methanobacteriales archaeon Met13]